VDEKLLKQVLFNIVGNALKFTAKGQVSLEVFGEYLDQHTYKFCFLISDTGIGIEEGKIANLFQPFSQADISTTREFGGTGLGLAITKDIVTLMGGTIDLQSKLNHGSKVTISLPLKVDAAYHSAVLRDKTKDDFSLASRHVVVLDDVITNTEVASMLLQQQGALVKTFNDGQSAIDYCLANPSIDVLFCDIQMPNMDGIQVTQTLRQAGFDNTIVGLSGNAMAIDRAHALANGMDDYMAKPFIIDDAIALLKRHLKTTLVEAV
jgi:CheY-like chemotaxis protein